MVRDSHFELVSELESFEVFASIIIAVFPSDPILELDTPFGSREGLVKIGETALTRVQGKGAHEDSGDDK
jgi:hypothetical protein